MVGVHGWSLPAVSTELMADAQKKPWLAVPIADCGEPLVPLPSYLPRVLPHPYVCLGAPYPESCGPWHLRLAVVLHLLRARSILKVTHPHWELQVFDAWRPIAVQTFMVNHAIQAEWDRSSKAQQADPSWRYQIEQQVLHLWDTPSQDPRTPPPPSAGAAVGLTLIDSTGQPIPMGSAIDELGPQSHPDHYARAPQHGAVHNNRRLLRHVMVAAGFVPHPWEWWHFSYGDQLWAWETGHVEARYGTVMLPSLTLAS